jgi:hypothetical protein
VRNVKRSGERRKNMEGMEMTCKLSVTTQVKEQRRTRVCSSYKMGGSNDTPELLLDVENKNAAADAAPRWVTI